MSLSTGIQKYRDVAKKTATRAPKKEKTSSDEGSSKRNKSEALDLDQELEERQASLSNKRRLIDSLDDSEAQVLDSEESETEAQELSADDDAEDADLERELTAEIAEDAKQTNALVKEDFSPTNSPRDKLIVEYSPLIKYIAQKIASRLPANIELDDLISSGVIGLMDAIDKYDSGRDNKFKTYAEFRIRGAILDELRAQDWVPRSVREKAKQLERCYSKIEQEKGRQATEEEVCAELGVNAQEFHDILNQVRSVSLLSYDDVSNFSKQDKRALHGYGEGGSKTQTPFSEVNVASVKQVIAEAINDLPEKQRLVLSLYYYEDLNLKEIGRVLDVTESRVSQLHTQAILRLKAKLKGNWDEFLTLMG